MDNTDYYAHLGVDPSSPPEEIVRAYHRLARQYHPDVNPYDADAVTYFKEINEAYQVLSDPEKRAQYDLQRASSRSSWVSEPIPTGPAQDEPPAPHEHTINVESKHANWNAEDIAEAVEQVAQGFAGEVREALRDFSAELDSLSRTFRADTRERPGHWRSAPPPPPSGQPPSGGRPPQDGKAPKP